MPGTIGDYKWVAFGDSLTDNTIPSPWSDGNPKYHTIISNETGLDVVVAGAGGTGYYRKDPFYRRLRSMSEDSSVNVVTIFGSVNDHMLWSGVTINEEERYQVPNLGYRESDGQMQTFAAWHRENKRDGRYDRFMTKQEAYGLLSFSDTVANTENTQYGVSWVAYVNECINLAHEKFPNAAIILVNEINFNETHANTLAEERAIKEALVAKRRDSGDSWLSLYKLNDCTFNGLADAERKYLNVISGKGLSFDQLSNADFCTYYTYDSKGHPNALYNRLWLAPVYANILCDVFGVDDSTLPDELSVDGYDISQHWDTTPIPPEPTTTYTATFKADGVIVDTVEFEAGATVLPRVPAVPAKTGYTGAWEQYTLTDADITINAVYTPVQPDAIAYDINGDEIYNAYDINGASIVKLYDINGESLV